MKRTLLSFFVMCLVLAAASAASAQDSFYCVKPDGMPVANIIMPPGARHDPSVVCNLVAPQCFLTCSAVVEIHSGQGVLPPDLPTVTVTPQMLNGLGQPAFESPQYCASQYQTCLANCRGDRACKAYCESVRSGCGTGNRGQ